MKLCKLFFLFICFSLIFASCADEDIILDADTETPNNGEEENPTDEPDGTTDTESAIRLDTLSYVIDSFNALVLYQGDNIELDGRIVIEKDTFDILPKDSNLELGKAYTIRNDSISYQLYRTEIPLVILNTDDIEIPDEPKISGTLTILEKGIEPFNSFIGIERRGGFSQNFPKKSYSMELWEDENGEDDISESLLGMRDDDDWILDGLWNEPLRIRDYTSHDIWLKIGRFPYNADEPETIFGIQRKFCEVFLNGAYRGIYYLGERIDRKQLKLKKFDDVIRGELYKGDANAPGVVYRDVEDFSNSSLTWSGYEAKYPEDDGELDWANLHGFVDFVVNSENEVFDMEIEARLDLQNAVDYFIFLNLTLATDNTGKNIYTGRYDTATPYFFVAWDMDGSFGNDFAGDRLADSNFTLSNGLYDRLVSNPKFVEELKSRWAFLKNEELSSVSLNEMFNSNYFYLRDNGVYARETLDPMLPRNYSDSEIDFINSWTNSRLDYLDRYINGL